MTARPAGSGYLNRDPRPIEDARYARAAELLRLAKELLAKAKLQHDAIPELQRRFGDGADKRLADLLFDLWSAADNLIFEIENRGE